MPTAGQWNTAFAAKQDDLGYVPLSIAGGTMTGRLVTAAPNASNSGLNITPGTTPPNPANGDLWVTNAGLFVRVNGVTIGPLSGGTASSFAATAPLSVSFPGGIVTYGLNTDSTLTVTGGNLALRLPNPNTWTGLQTFSAGVSIASAFSAPGLVKNSDLVNASTTVNGQTCALGGVCTITASAGTVSIGVTTVALGNSARVLFDNAGVLGEYPITGTGNVVMSGSPTLTGTVTAAAANVSGAVSIGGTVTIANVLETFPPSGNLAGTADTQTLTNKTISGANNTLLNIPNAALLNSSITVGGVNCVLGSTCTPTQIGTTTGASLALNGCTIGVNTLCITGPVSITSPSAAAFVVGPGGATNPAFQVDASATSQAAGLKITGAATGGAVRLDTIDSGANTNLSINGKGTGSISIGNISSGGIGLGNATVIQSASANALAVGPNGGSNPVLQVNASVASSVTGVSVVGQAAGNGAGIGVVSPSTNEGLSINGKGSGVVAIGNVSTGAVQVGQGGGGLTVFNSFTASGLVTYADLASAALANASQYFAGASNVVVPASVIYQAETTTTYGTTTTFDFSTFINTAVTMVGNITTMTLNNVKAGQAGTIAFIQDSTGGRTAVFNSIFKFAGGVTPSLSTTPNAVDVLTYSCRSASFCVASLIPNVK
ncbi:hypothetical protein [Bradyrhizobium sp. STM 3843]|uniref:beta strand repeat-containing protein n=1 Tax=Bradyrhizobium sp. STM 3843 TaxID=551947 RepID=UPI0011125C2B|nr:hypothetical protein [Bradyrhizobium sp. STM 3843]